MSSKFKVGDIVYTFNCDQDPYGTATNIRSWSLIEFEVLDVCGHSIQVKQTSEGYQTDYDDYLLLNIIEAELLQSYLNEWIWKVT